PRDPWWLPDVGRAVHGTRSTTNLEYHSIEEIDYSRYENGLSVIAVGGSRLARGITLEGLSTSYYLRTTKMYDSLMQMGRWFGYRPGYVDLCRLFTTDIIFEWFNHITMATEEMRNDFDVLTATFQKPKDFRLKVRNHHGLLTITSVAKLNWAENITVSFSGTNPQTYQLTKTESVITSNFNAFQSLFLSLRYPVEIAKNKANNNIPRYLIYRNCNIEFICDFLDKYKTETPPIKNANLSEYIKSQTEIKEWNVVLVSNTDARVFIDEKGNSKAGEREKNKDLNSYTLKWYGDEITLGCSVRNQPKSRRDSLYYFISKNQIDDTTDRQVDLLVQDKKSNKEIKEQRKLEKKGLLLIYALDQRGTPNADFGKPIIGYSIHFPEIENEKKTSYTATLFNGFDDEPMEDDDNQDNE
ncbi:MAG: Z1 domain-containing protein, partial [Candidatus Paceibacterota bacterium]